MDYPDELKIQMDALAAQRRATAIKRAYRITDAGPGFFRQAVVEAEDREAAQEAYIAAMERVGAAHGELTVRLDASSPLLLAP